MTLPLYTIVPDGDAFQVCLVFRDDTLPIPGKRYTSHEVARMVVHQMEHEDYALWQAATFAPPSREYDENGDVI